MFGDAIRGLICVISFCKLLVCIFYIIYIYTVLCKCGEKLISHMTFLCFFNANNFYLFSQRAGSFKRNSQGMQSQNVLFDKFLLVIMVLLSMDRKRLSLNMVVRAVF